MAASRSSGGNRVWVLFILLGIAAAAAWFMRETVEHGAPQLPGLASSNGSAANRTGRGPEAPSGPTSPSTVGGQTVPSGRDQTAPGDMSPALPGVASGTPTDASGSTPGRAPQTAAASPGGTPSSLSATGSDPYSAGSDPYSAGSDLSGAAIPELHESPVQATFVDDLAVFLVQNYWPKGTHPSAVRRGISTVSMKWANLRYGAEGRGLTLSREDPARGRMAILRYAMKPGILQVLYAADAHRLIDAMAEAADRRIVKLRNTERPLTPSEKSELYAIYAAQARALAAAIATYAADAGMPSRVLALDKAEQAVYEANTAYIESMAAYEEAKDAKDARAAAAQQRMEQAATAYQESIQTRVAIRTDLESAMGQKAEARSLGGDTLVYCAQWLYRRGAGQEDVFQAASGILADLAGRFAGAAKK